MPWPPRLLRRTSVKGVAVVAVVCAAFAAGVVTGASGSRHVATSGGKASAADHEPAGVADLDAIRDRLTRQSVHRVTTGTLDAAAVKAMLLALHDPWSAFFDADDYAAYEATLDGHYSGVGLRLTERSDGTVLVSGVQAGSPAAKAQVADGAELTSIDGRPVTGLSAGQVALLLRGPRGSAVTIGLRTSDGARNVRLVRTQLTSHDVTVDWLTPQVARITITAFTRGVGREVRTAMRTLHAEHAGGVVLDLRGNPGGLLDEAVEAASAFLDGGPVVSYERRNSAPQVLDASAGGDTTTPLAVLVDGGTASAAEVLAGALQDRHRAVIVGTRTFGKGTVQQPIRLSDGSVVELTVAQYRTPDGRSLDGVGLEPDIELQPGAPESLAQQRAVEVLTGLLADAGTGGRG